MSPTIRVLLADDHPIVCYALERLLDTTPGVTLAGVVGNGSDAIDECARLRPDVLVLDLVMPGPDPVDVVAGVRQASPKTRIPVYSAYDDDARVWAMREAGAVGYLVKSESLDTVLRAIRTVASGATWFPGSLQKRPAAPLRGLPGALPGHAHAPIAAREERLLRLLLAGNTNEQVAEELNVSPRTVSRMVRRLCDRLGLASRAELLPWAARHGVAGARE